MSKKNGKALVSALAVVMLAIGVSGCNEQQSAPAPIPTPVPPPAIPGAPGAIPGAPGAIPGAPGAAIPTAPGAVPGMPTAQPPVASAPAAPPATPLIPVDEPTESEPTPRKGRAGIDAPLPGQKTPGDELIGNYQCKLDAKQLKIGPFKAPPFGCKIYKAGDGSLKVSSTSDGAGSMKGNIKDSTAVGFFITGNYTIAGNKMAIKARMKLKGAGKYVGRGRGRFNDDKSEQFGYTLTMTRQ